MLFARSREVSAADLDGEIINIGPVGGNVGPPFEPGGSTTVFVRIRNTGTENAHFRVFVHSVSSRWSADDNCFDIFGTTCSVRDVEPGLEPFRTYTVGSPSDGGSGTIIWKLEVASAGCLILHLCDWTEVDTGVLSVFSGERATEFDLDEDPLLDVSGLVDPVGATGRALGIDIPQESGFKVNRNFEGLSAAEAGSDPPDPQIAVGPRHVVELLNNMGRIFTKNGRVVQTFYLGDFFNVPSVPSNGGRFFDHNFDPKIIYDARENRFFAIYSSRNEDADLGRLHIAVSITDDPTGTWRRWVMEFDGVFPDFPAIGLTNDKVTVSYNRNPLALTRFDTIFVDFDLATLLGILANYGGEQTVVFNKSQMLAPQGTTVRGAQFDSRITRVTMRPAHSLGSINDQYGVHLNPLSMLADTPVALLETVQLILEGVDPSLIAEYFLGQVGAILHQDKIVGVPGESEVKRVTRSLGIRFQQLPPPAIQKDTVHLLWPGASWLLDATYRNGTLTITGGATYCKFGGDPLDRSCTHIIQLSPGENPSVTMDRYLGAGGVSFMYPSHRTDASDNLHVVFGLTGSDRFPQIRVTGLADGAAEFEPSIRVKAGETAVPAPTGALPLARYGDYFGSAVDPEFPDCVWHVAEYAKDNPGDGPKWGTWIARTTFSNAASPCDVQGRLDVTPNFALTSTGVEGGPFSPISKEYELTNEGGDTISWAASRSHSWVSFSPGSGTLDGGESATVTVSLNIAANDLAVGAHCTSVSFKNTTNNQANASRSACVSVKPPGSLLVNPSDGLVAVGLQGGPFDPSGKQYVLHNPGGSAIEWRASKTANWTSVLPGGGIIEPGASMTVDVLINFFANSLAPGNEAHTDTIGFTNETNGNGSTTRPVSLTVNVPPGLLEVTPEGGFSSSGGEGGPFTPASKTYTLRNSGGEGLAWAATISHSWFRPDPFNGTLDPGQSTPVVVSIVPGFANDLPIGSNIGWVNFFDQTNSVLTQRPTSLTVVRPGVLAVTPGENMDSSGGQGGPFSPSTKTYTLRNTGEVPFEWAPGSSEAWDSVSQAAGTLEGGQSVEVEVSINENANALAPGSHMSFLSFVNVTYLRGNAFPRLNLEVAEPGRLEVTPPEGLITSGKQGGPFGPSRKTYTLTNPGGGPISWSAATTQRWTTVSSSVGTLEAGESGSVTVSVNSFANGLSPGSYGDTVSFTNDTNGGGDTTRDVDLTVTSAFRLTVFRAGDGAGTVTSLPFGIACGTGCRQDYEAQALVTLNAMADVDSFFTGWRGACSGTPDCQVAMESDRSVVATFELQIVEVVQGVVTARDGGTVSTGSEDPVEASITVPPEAVDDTRISVTVFRAGAPALPPVGDNIAFLSRVFDFGPDGLRFSTPAAMIITYTDVEVAGKDKDNLQPLVFNSSKERWDTLRIVARDVDNNSITFEVTSFSLFGLAVVTPPSPACVADVSMNGIVDTDDLGIVVQALGSAAPDLNGDGIVDVLDLAMVGRYFGEVCG